MTKKLETSLVSGARPIACSAARTVSPVVFAAPPTVPSASPAATAKAAKYNGRRAVSHRFFERYAARAPALIVNLRVGFEARARGRVDDRNVRQRDAQIRGHRLDDSFPAEQSDLRKPFARDRRRCRDDARIFALGQHDALGARSRAGLQLFDQSHRMPKLSQVCSTWYFCRIEPHTNHFGARRRVYAISYPVARTE